MSSTTLPHQAEATPCTSRLANMPVAFFAMVMGMAGLSIVYLKAGHILWEGTLPGVILTGITATLFAILALGYAGKAILHFDKVREEFASPIKLQFFPTISISLLLLSIALLHLLPAVSFWIWSVGTAAHLLFTLSTLSIWMHHDQFEINHIKPTWFIPVVGNILVPIAGVDHAHADLSWFFFSIGLIFWLMLFTIFLYRIIFHHPLAGKRLPTFFILIAPPAVGFISYLRLNGEVDNFARILYFFAVFLFLLLAYQWRMFLKIKFFISWWAYSFPIAALTVATLLMLGHTDAPWMRGLAWGFLILVTLVVLVLLGLTARAVKNCDVCTEEH